VAIGFTNMKTLLSLALKKKSGKFPFTLFTVKLNRENLESLRILFEQKQIKPYIHQTYPSDQIPEAIRHIETSHIKGKVVMVREKNEEKIDGGRWAPAFCSKRSLSRILSYFL